MNTVQIKVKVAGVEQVAPSIREYTFTAVNEVLHPFSLGAHIVVKMANSDKIYRNA